MREARLLGQNMKRFPFPHSYIFSYHHLVQKVCRDIKPSSRASLSSQSFVLFTFWSEKVNKFRWTYFPKVVHIPMIRMDTLWNLSRTRSMQVFNRFFASRLCFASHQMFDHSFFHIFSVCLCSHHHFQSRVFFNMTFYVIIFTKLCIKKPVIIFLI